MNTYDPAYLDLLPEIHRADQDFLREKEKTHRGSWMRRGGVGAFMMIARKWDRLEGMLAAVYFGKGRQYDIFDHVVSDPSGEDGSALAEIRDLRRYLALVEAQLMHAGVVPRAPSSFDEVAPVPPCRIQMGTHTHQIPEGRTIPVTDNRHARQPYLMDGLPPRDYAEVPCICVSSIGAAIVDRRAASPEIWEHLPRLAVELNHREWTDAPPEYRWMYNFENSAAKYVLDERWREHWGRRP